VVSFTPRPLYPQGKSPWYPLDRRLAGSQSRSGHGGEKKNSQPLSGLEPPIIQPEALRCTIQLPLLLPCPLLYSNTIINTFFFNWPSLMDFSIHRHLVGLLGWGISPTQGLNRNTGQHKTETRRHTSMPREEFEPAILMFKLS
jgi:hypothetical protein